MIALFSILHEEYYMKRFPEQRKLSITDVCNWNLVRRIRWVYGSMLISLNGKGKYPSLLCLKGSSAEKESQVTFRHVLEVG